MEFKTEGISSDIEEVRTQLDVDKADASRQQELHAKIRKEAFQRNLIADRLSSNSRPINYRFR